MLSRKWEMNVWEFLFKVESERVEPEHEDE